MNFGVPARPARPVSNAFLEGIRSQGYWGKALSGILREWHREWHYNQHQHLDQALWYLGKLSQKIPEKSQKFPETTRQTGPGRAGPRDVTPDADLDHVAKEQKMALELALEFYLQTRD